MHSLPLVGGAWRGAGCEGPWGSYRPDRGEDKEQETTSVQSHQEDQWGSHCESYLLHKLCELHVHASNTDSVAKELLYIVQFIFA